MKTQFLAALAIGGTAFGLYGQVSYPLPGGGSVPGEIHLPGCTCFAHGGVFNRTLVYAGEATVDRRLPGQGATTLSGFDIVINAGPALAANAAALAAFNAAAAIWESWFKDPVTVIIDADLAALPPGVIGGALNSFVTPGGGYGAVRSLMIADNVGSVTQDVTDAIPSTLTAFTPLGVTSISPIMSQANAKALGFTVPGGADATITFSTAISFDFDPSDGIGAGLIDFTGVALHEIGHVLGFSSVVDQIDGGLTDVGFFPLDIFRFGPEAGHNPASAADFTSMFRDFRPGVAAYTDIVNAARGSGPEYLMSTGVLTGDGRQASHWKDNSLTSILIGLMDPTLGFGETGSITFADINALDVVGWDVVPEPHEYAAAFGLAALGFAAVRRWQARRA